MSSRVISPVTQQTIEYLGARIRQARIERGWTQAELAGRAGITTRTLGRAEKGSPSVTIGTVFELTAITGLVLFATDSEALDQLADKTRTDLTLLPERVRTSDKEVRDDF